MVSSVLTSRSAVTILYCIVSQMIYTVDLEQSLNSDTTVLDSQRMILYFLANAIFSEILQLE